MYKKEHAVQKDEVKGIYQYLVGGFSKEEASKYEEWFDHPYDAVAFERWIGADVAALIRAKWFEWIMHHEGEIERPKIDEIYSAIIAPKDYPITPPLDLPALAPARINKVKREYRRYKSHRAGTAKPRPDMASTPAVSKTCSEAIRCGAVS